MAQIMRRHLSQGMVSLLDISNSNNEETHKATACARKVHAKVTFSMLPGEMNRFTRGMMP